MAPQLSSTRSGPARGDDLGDGYALLHISRHLMHDGGSSAFKALKEKATRAQSELLRQFDHVISTLPDATAETPSPEPRLYSMRVDAKPPACACSTGERARASCT